MDEHRKTLQDGLRDLRAMATRLQEIWDKREAISSDLVKQATLIAEDGAQGKWSAYSTAAMMLTEKAKQRLNLNPEREAQMVGSIAQTLKESCGYMEVIEDIIMPVLKTHLLWVELEMRQNQWEIPEWKECPWLGEITGKD